MIVRLQPAAPVKPPGNGQEYVQDHAPRRRRGERGSVFERIALVLRRLPLVLLAFGLPLVASYALLRALPAQYAAEASVFADGETAAGRRTFLDMATARPVIDRMMQRPDIAPDLAMLQERDPGAWLAGLIERIRGRATAPDAARLRARLEDGLAATPAAQANVLTLSASAASPDSAARLANAFAAAFVEEASALARTPAAPDSRAAGLRRTLADAEAALAAARRQQPAVAPVPAPAPAAPVPARPVAAGPAPDWPALQRRFEAGEVEAVATLIRTPALERLGRDVAEARAQEATLRVSLGARHPSAVEARQLFEERLKLLSEAVRLAIAAGRAGVSPVASPAPTPNQASAAGVDIAALERAVANARAAYDAFLRSPEGQSESRIARILAPAVAPVAASFPPRRLIWGLGLAASLLLGFGALWRALVPLWAMRRRSLTPHHTAASPPAGGNAAAPVPRVDDGPPRPASAVTAQPAPILPPGLTPGQMADEISTRAAIAALQSWAVTGSDPDAIVTVALGVAAEAARRHLRVLMLDAAERQPALSRYLRDAPVSGHVMLHGVRRPLASFEPSRGAPVWLAPALSSLTSTAEADLPLVVPALAGHFDLLLIIAPAIVAGRAGPGYNQDEDDRAFADVAALAMAAQGAILAEAGGVALDPSEIAGRLGISPQRLRRVGETAPDLAASPSTTGNTTAPNPRPGSPSGRSTLIRLDVAG